MAANYDLVVVHGPPSPAIPSVLKQRLSDEEEYVHVHPLQLYHDNPDFGVRDIANNVLHLLRKHKKVVVEDCSAAGAVRDCLLRIVPKKMSACTVHLIELVPRHGTMQVMWEQQFFLAASLQPHLLLSDESLLHWFDEQGCIVSSGSTSMAPPKGSKETVTVNLTATSHYKFEVPALLIQWECVVDSGNCLEHKMKTACQHWSEANPCGRVVLLCDGNSVAKGLLSASQEKARIISCTKAMASELPCPVYVVQLTSTLDAGEFCIPPNPGLLAFLHRRHQIDLHHRSTVYIYSDVKHMKMSEKAGVRHIKIGKVLKSPQMMSSCHCATASPIPEMLRQMQVVPDATGSGDCVAPQPTIPLADRLEDFDDQHICVDHSRGHREFVFAKDVELLQSFQTLYADCATPVGERGSRMAGCSEQPRSKTQQRSKPPASSSRASLEEQTSEPAQLRQIPKWMLGRRGSSSGPLSTQATLEKSSSNSSVEGCGRSRHTIYIMTEKELLETAKDILKQAGREDIISTSDVQSTMTVDPDGAKKNIQDSDVPATTGKRRPGARNADMSETANESSGEREGPTPAEKKQRLEPTTATTEVQLCGTTTEVKERLLAPLTGDQSNTSPPPNVPVKTAKRKPAPDLSVLDEIFS